MNHLMITERVAKELATRSGWERHPGQDHHFWHRRTNVHILVYAGELVLTFGDLPGRHDDKAVGAKTKHFPTLAITSVLEVADALVVTRLVTAWRAEVAAAWEQAFKAGDEPGPGPG
jgi:hypothetical protein